MEAKPTTKTTTKPMRVAAVPGQPNYSPGAPDGRALRYVQHSNPYERRR